MQRIVITLARWLANRTVKAEWKAQGRKPKIGEISKATNLYFTEHQKELIREAWEHPIVMNYRQQDRIRLARKAMISEIRKGRRLVCSARSDLKSNIQVSVLAAEHDVVSCAMAGAKKINLKISGCVAKKQGF
jgi:hypothetical protein